MLLAELSVVGARVCCRGAGSFAGVAAAQEQGAQPRGGKIVLIPQAPGLGIHPSAADGPSPGWEAAAAFLTSGAVATR